MVHQFLFRLPLPLTSCSSSLSSPHHSLPLLPFSCSLPLLPLPYLGWSLKLHQRGRQDGLILDWRRSTWDVTQGSCHPCLCETLQVCTQYFTMFILTNLHNTVAYMHTQNIHWYMEARTVHVCTSMVYNNV